MIIEKGKTYTYKTRGGQGRVISQKTVTVNDIKPAGRGSTVTYTHGKSVISEALGKFQKAIA